MYFLLSLGLEFVVALRVHLFIVHIIDPLFSRYFGRPHVTNADLREDLALILSKPQDTNDELHEDLLAIIEQLRGLNGKLDGINNKLDDKDQPHLTVASPAECLS